MISFIRSVLKSINNLTVDVYVIIFSSLYVGYNNIYKIKIGYEDLDKFLNLFIVTSLKRFFRKW